MCGQGQCSDPGLFQAFLGLPFHIALVPNRHVHRRRPQAACMQSLAYVQETRPRKRNSQEIRVQFRIVGTRISARDKL
jgi:hypothetical protein